MAIVCKHIQYTLKNGKVKSGFFLDDNLKNNFDFDVKRLKVEFDAIFPISGPEGAGKSTAVQEFGAYFAEKFGTSFDINNIVFTSKQFFQAVNTLPKYSVIVWDEMVLSSAIKGDRTDQMEQSLYRLFTTMRSKQFIIFIVIPNFTALKHYFAIERSRYLIHITIKNNIDRGYFRVFDKLKKERMFMSKDKSYNCDTALAELYNSCACADQVTQKLFGMP